MSRMLMKQIYVMRGDSKPLHTRQNVVEEEALPLNFLKCLEAAYPLSRHGSCQRIPWKAEVFSSITSH